jgi:hypothetical protein
MDEQQICQKCRSTRTRVIGQSLSPLMFYVLCDGCGCTTTVAPPRTSASIDARRVERLVRSLMTDLALPCEQLAVTQQAGEWQVVVMAVSRPTVIFQVKPAALSAMRDTIKRALATAC